MKLKLPDFKITLKKRFGMESGPSSSLYVEKRLANEHLARMNTVLRIKTLMLLENQCNPALIHKVATVFEQTYKDYFFEENCTKSTTAS